MIQLLNKILAFTTAIAILLSSATILAKQSTMKATTGYTTAIHKDLQSLPQPKTPLVAAVYKFRDQTGQYKTGAYGQSWSMAVTQGATSMLIKALEDSKWFIPVEREGLADLMNERKIISTAREIQAQRDGQPPQQLPSLLYAGVILEGGIISYESNLVTTGIGIKYFGMGGNVKVQQDRVTVYLRAVSSQTGQIIKTVHASRNILSEQVDGGLYRFVKFKKLLEVEAGFSTNEPVQMCVLEAIEKAVLALIIEGITEKYWSLENELDMNSPVITEYLKERESGGNFETFPVESANATKFGVGLSVGTHLTGVDGDRKVEPLFKNQFQYFFNPFISGIVGVNVGRINSEYLESELSLTIDLKGSFDLFPQFRVSPCLISGAGIIKTWVKEPECGPVKEKYPLGIIPAFICGCGLRYRFDNSKSLIMTAENHVTFQEIDGNEEKEKSSKLITLAIGMSFSLSGKTR